MNIETLYKVLESLADDNYLNERIAVQLQGYDETVLREVKLVFGPDGQTCRIELCGDNA